VNIAEIAFDWSDIHSPVQNLIIEKRQLPVSAASIERLLKEAPFSRRAEGTLDQIKSALAMLPEDVRTDISALGSRFMALMQTSRLRVRVEGVTNNACKKLHSDFTDLRLITTYAGPGTDYAPHDDDCCLERLPVGAIGLFKGKLFGEGHAPCRHRSPPIEGTGVARLVLVIDTPERQEFHTI